MKQFELIPIKKPKTSLFDLSHERKGTTRMGRLDPVFLQEVIPGDRFQVRPDMFMRLMPTLAPVMHRVNVFLHFFFVPNRIIWDEWEKFITGEKVNGLEVNHPKITNLNRSDTYGFYPCGMETWKAFGLPTPTQLIGASDADKPLPDVSQLPFRAFQLIWSEYYRDQNLEEKPDIPMGSEDIDAVVDVDERIVLMNEQHRDWEKDYFTSSLPNAQRGDAVRLPLIGEIDVTGQPFFTHDNGSGSETPYLNGAGFTTNASGELADNAGLDAWIRDGLKGDLETNTATTVNELRTAFALQRWLEKSMRAGQRYIEQILVHFGVKSSDRRLQRPWYLGGGKLPVMISEVEQNSQTDTTPQGNLAGKGVAGGNFIGFNEFFEEHGFIIGMLSILPRTAYQEGLDKVFSKFDRFDYFTPDFAHIGEVPVLNKEIYATSAEPDGTFGYQPRYQDYRAINDKVTGLFRTNLAYWHMGTIFGDDEPTLSEDLVVAYPTDRIFAVQDGSDNVIYQIYFDVKAIRPVPKFGEPI